jgi:hypothetical protein
MKYSQWIGIVAAAVLVFSCTLNWTWYPDIQQYFTGFYSQNNQYGKPGKVFIILTVISVVFYLVPRLWAKRWNVFLCCIIVAFGIRTFLIFSACYVGICPERQTGIWIMLICAALMLLAALLPDLRINDQKSRNTSDK